MAIVISVENVSKYYQLGSISNRTLYQDLNRWWAKMHGRPDPLQKIGESNHNNSDGEYIWALRDVSLKVHQGEVIGIIGRNGAGKSTLLKILSQVTSPTMGQIKLKGRIVSLLEVGTGFHPDLTGRENIYLNGAILGMVRQEIKRKFDEIVDFSGVEQFIDTPVKRYSSGMYVRLAFAVAAHLETEILLVDEVLAVGDINFQKKCMGKMGTEAKEGRTILFVSHNLASISNLCTKGLVLENGRIVYISTATDAVVYYTKQQTNREDDNQKEIVEAGTTRFISARILDQKGHSLTTVQIDEPCVIEMIYETGAEVNSVAVPNFHFTTAEGIIAFVVNAPNVKKNDPGIYVAKCNIPPHLLNEGTYTIGLALTEYPKLGHIVHFFKQHYLTLNVQDTVIDNPHRYGYGGQWGGVLRPLLEWQVEHCKNVNISRQ
jgi:lipopolysaccharide transport system ATP-binding protein